MIAWCGFDERTPDGGGGGVNTAGKLCPAPGRSLSLCPAESWFRAPHKLRARRVELTFRKHIARVETPRDSGRTSI